MGTTSIFDAPWRRALPRFGIVASLLAALGADLPWGDFHGHTHWANVGWIPFVSPPVRVLDIAENLLLFAPLGFFVALESDKEPERRKQQQVLSDVEDTHGRRDKWDPTDVGPVCVAVEVSPRKVGAKSGEQ